MSKVYAKEVNPAFVESPFWADYCETDGGTSYDGLTILHCDSRGAYLFDWTRVKHTELYDRVLDRAEEAYEAVWCFKMRDKDSYWCRNYKNLTEYLTVRLQPERKLSTRDVHYLKEFFWNLEDEDMDNFERRHDEIAKVMTILSGRQYDVVNLYGYCQGDVVTCIYPTDEWSKESLNTLETEYWNGGHEFEVTSEDDEVGYCIYFTEYDYDDIRDEIASECGVEAEEVEMYTYF
jgi:hypothetical protein